MAHTCPLCGQSNVPGTLFCDGCGSALLPEVQARPAAPAIGTGSIGGSAAEVVRFPTGDVSRAAGVAEVEKNGAGGAPAADPAAADPLYTWAEVSEPGSLLSPEPPAAQPAAPSMTPAYLVSDTGRRVDVPLQDVAIVGREDARSGIRPDVDLTLDGASAAGVSRRHCRLLRQADGWYVEDLMSTNFTVLNGQALAPHVPTRVQHGDQLRLGKLRLTFREG